MNNNPNPILNRPLMINLPAVVVDRQGAANPRPNYPDIVRHVAQPLVQAIVQPRNAPADLLARYPVMPALDGLFGNPDVVRTPDSTRSTQTFFDVTNPVADPER